MKPKVGHIEFLNCLPLYYGLIKSNLDIELIKGTPTELNRLLINGSLDISPMSSIEYARHKESLVLFPDLAISSDGEAKSIIMLSRLPIKELHRKRVSLANTSATSQLLLKIILIHHGIEPEYFISPPDPDSMLASSDAALLIGDIALRYYVDTKDFYLYDLGTEWKKLTGKKMVYAVWAVNRRFAETQNELSRYVFEALQRSKLYSQEHIDEISEYARMFVPFSLNFLKRYFKTLQFDFGEDYQEGLLLFYKLAVEVGALREVPELEFMNI